MLAGLISYPVLTRLLSREEYGIFGYFETWVVILIALLKLGTQHSIIRFFSVHCGKGDPDRERTFYTNYVLVPAAISTVLAVLVLAGIWIYHAHNPIPEFRFLVIVFIISQIGVYASLIDNVLRARELSNISAWFAVGQRWVQLILVVGIVWLISRSAMGVYVGRLIATVLALGWILRWAQKYCSFDWRSLDTAMLRESFAFGMPLVLSEISFILLAQLDRLMLKHILGGYESVGLYVIGYGLAMYISVFMHASLFQAFVPVANRLYNTEGENAVRALKRRILTVMLYPSIAIIVGLWIIGADALVLLAGEDNRPSAPIFVWVGSYYALHPIFMAIGYGLPLAKRSKTMLAIGITATLINLGLNWIWIPRFGVMGSVYATMVSYGALAVLEFSFCPRGLKTLPRWRDLSLPLGLGAVLFAVAHFTNLFGLDSTIARLLAMAGLAVVLFFIPAIALDRRLRSFLRDRIAPVWSRWF